MAGEHWCPRGYTLLGDIVRQLLAWKAEGRSVARPKAGMYDELVLAFGMGELPAILISLEDQRDRPCPREFLRARSRLEAALGGEVVYAGIDCDEPCVVAVETAALAKWFGLSPGLDSPKAEAELPKTKAAALRGRSYRTSDAPLVAEMRERIANGVDATATSAARAVVHKATGDGSPRSKVDRLVALYHRPRVNDPLG